MSSGVSHVQLKIDYFFFGENKSLLHMVSKAADTLIEVLENVKAAGAIEVESIFY